MRIGFEQECSPRFLPIKILNNSVKCIKPWPVDNRSKSKENSPPSIATTGEGRLVLFP